MAKNELSTPATKPQKMQITFGIKPDVYKSLLYVSRKKYVTVNEVVRIAIGEYLNRTENIEILKTKK
jgi:hypothetical protein